MEKVKKQDLIIILVINPNKGIWLEEGNKSSLFFEME